MPEGLEMSLSDRLQRARTQQLIKSGVLPADFVIEAESETAPLTEVEPVPMVADTSGGLFAPVTIEVQPIGLHLVANATVDLTDMPEHENEARCPTCNAVAVADMVDLVGHTVHYSCNICSTMWQVRKRVVHDDTLADA